METSKALHRDKLIKLLEEAQKLIRRTGEDAVIGTGVLLYIRYESVFSLTITLTELSPTFEEDLRGLIRGFYIRRKYSKPVVKGYWTRLTDYLSRVDPLYKANFTIFTISVSYLLLLIYCLIK